MRFDRLSKAQGAYILGEAIGHERTAAVGECPVRRAVRHGLSPIELGPHCPPELRKCKRYRAPAVVAQRGVRLTQADIKEFDPRGYPR